MFENNLIKGYISGTIWVPWRSIHTQGSGIYTGRTTHYYLVFVLLETYIRTKNFWMYYVR